MPANFPKKAVVLAQIPPCSSTLQLPNVQVEFIEVFVLLLGMRVMRAVRLNQSSKKLLTRKPKQLAERV